FLERKMPDIDLGDKENAFAGAKNPLLEKFLYVNETLRKQNVETVLAVPSDTVGKMMWQGRFGRLAGAANRAKFADRRIYKYKGKEIDRAVHLGVDLASTSNAPVGAANKGRVIMASDEGIFGNTVIIDHGFGLASLYSHLSDILVKNGDEVSKGDIIGNTGLSGLAGGDHLHLSIIVHNTFVNPVEWWDPNWIKNNITSKIDAVKKDIK
ncbi:MAG: M23 family metallopeptidase, partial [Desulfobacterales bacterium]|nr:M23 family metallopeptidase [Desulfobacterales bacterium]